MKISFVIIKALGGGAYLHRWKSDSALGTLGRFLALDVSTDTWLEWIDDDQYMAASGNITGLEKGHEGRVVLFNLYRPPPKGSYIELTREQLRSVIVKWLALRAQAVNFVTIFREGNEIWLRGHNDRCPIDDAQSPHINQ